MQKLGNVEVVRVLEETEKAVWFAGPSGVLYRYLKAWQTAWPVERGIVPKEGAVLLESPDLIINGVVYSKTHRLVEIQHPSSWEVELTFEEKEEADEHGRRKHYESRKSNLRNFSGEKLQKALLHDMHGAGAEKAFSKRSGWPWPKHIGTGQTYPDVGPYDVRTTDAYNYSLIHRGNDHKERQHILMAGKLGSRIYKYKGWMWGYDCRHNVFIENPPGETERDDAAWFVPQKYLHQEIESVIKKPEEIPFTSWD